MLFVGLSRCRRESDPPRSLSNGSVQKLSPFSEATRDLMHLQSRTRGFAPTGCQSPMLIS